MTDTIVLAYSGGLDTSVLVKWIQQNYNADVVTVTLDVGQQSDLEVVGEKAHSLGVKKHYSIDVKADFVTDYVFPAIKANALYEGKYPVSTALSRPPIASKLVEIAEKEEAAAVAHGCTGKGNDQIRFEIAIKSLAPNLEVIAPVREWEMTREEEIEFAESNGIQISSLSDPYSIDQNLWGRSIECGPLEDPSQEPPAEIFEWTVSPEEAPDQPEYLTIQFEEGIPCAINGEEMDPLTLIKTSNHIAGSHGVGRIDHIEDRFIGIKSREVYECPAATVLLESHKDLEKSVLTRHEVLFKEKIDSQWAFMVYSGLWMDPLREDLEAFIDKTQQRVSGEVKVKLYKGGVQVVGRSSTLALYDQNLSSHDIPITIDQSSSQGFIEFWGLPTRTFNLLKKKMDKDHNPEET
ncbi:MAG: argininosuccinate synthase [Thermoproteota archaeon]